MREQVIETGPRTPPADPAQADTPPAWSSLITGFRTHQEPTPRLPLSSLDPTDYRYFDFVIAGFDLTPVITHRFPLERWDEAVLALKDPGRTGAVKVLLEP